MAVNAKQIKLHPIIRDGKFYYQVMIGDSRYEGMVSQKLNPGFDTVNEYSQFKKWDPDTYDMILSVDSHYRLKVQFILKGMIRKEMLTE